MQIPDLVKAAAAAVTAAAILPPSPSLPQLHDTGNIPRGEDPPDVVEVSNEDAAICSTGQC